MSAPVIPAKAGILKRQTVVAMDPRLRWNDLWLWLLSLLLLLVALTAQAQSFPALSGRVVDAANIIPDAEEAALDAKLAALEDTTDRQLVVATIPSLDGYPIEDYANRLFRNWGLGQKETDNGVLLLVAPNDRKVRIEVGYGLEPILTDAWTSVLNDTVIIPKFKAGDYSSGIADGVEKLSIQLHLPDDQAIKIADRNSGIIFYMSQINVKHIFKMFMLQIFSLVFPVFPFLAILMLSTLIHNTCRYIYEHVDPASIPNFISSPISKFFSYYTLSPALIISFLLLLNIEYFPDINHINSIVFFIFISKIPLIIFIICIYILVERFRRVRKRRNNPNYKLSIRILSDDYINNFRKYFQDLWSVLFFGFGRHRQLRVSSNSNNAKLDRDNSGSYSSYGSSSDGGYSSDWSSSGGDFSGDGGSSGGGGDSGSW